MPQQDSAAGDAKPDITLHDVMAHLNHKFQQMDARFDGIERRLDGLEKEIRDFRDEFRAFAKGNEDLDLHVQELEEDLSPALETAVGLTT